MPLDLQVIPPWLDEETSALVKEKAELLAQRHPDVLAIILYGSVARHEERSLNGPDPSDVDLLVVVNGNRDAVRSQMLALVHTAGLAEDRHLGAPREVKVLFSSRTSQEWDPDFIANVKRDGRILYRRGELPAVLATWDIRSEKSERCAKNITKERPSRAGSMSHLPKKKEDLIAAGPSCFAASSVRKAKS